jgi:hypothetical protein
MKQEWQWALGALIAPLVIVFVANTWEYGDAVARDAEARHLADIVDIRHENDRQTDRLSELGKLNAETAARLEALGDRQDRVERRLDDIERQSRGKGN